jgi:hypothetical protein
MSEIPQLDDAQSRLELAVWSALRRLDVDFERLLSMAATDPQRPELRAEYLFVRDELRAPIEQLRQALVDALPEPRITVGEPWAERVFAALLIAYDERELRTLTDPEYLAAVDLLQTQYMNLFDGGEKFFEYTEQALRSRQTPQLVLQLLLYCLRADFCGRFLKRDDPERIAHQNELSDRVCMVQLETKNVALVNTPPKPIQGRGFPYLLYVLALLVVICTWGALKAAAYMHEKSRFGITECIDP